MAGFNDLKLGFDSLTYMQDMTTAKCAAAGVYETKQLIDNRDNKKYWVTKLQDGNCWMSQNLDLDLNKANLLTSANSDVSSNWPSAAIENALWTGSSSNYNVIQYYDPGEYVYMTPNVQRNCGTVTSMERCVNYGWTSINGLIADADPNFTAKSENWSISGTHYDTHYLVGNYYSWGAATAGTANAVSGSGDASSSICPKGWQLPINSSNIGTKSFYSVLREYGVNSSLISTTTIPQFDIRLSPLFFVYGGYVNNSSLNNAGNSGYYWSSTASSANNAYILVFNTSVNPSNYNFYRYYGYSVRCVAR